GVVSRSPALRANRYLLLNWATLLNLSYFENLNSCSSYHRRRLEKPQRLVIFLSPPQGPIRLEEHHGLPIPILEATAVLAPFEEIGIQALALDPAGVDEAQPLDLHVHTILCLYPMLT